MPDRVDRKDDYGAFLVALVKAHGLSLSDFARRLGISRTYLFDIINGRVKPPAPDMQEKIIALLDLKDQDRERFYDNTAAGRGELPKDVFEYLFDNADAIETIRERMRE